MGILSFGQGGFFETLVSGQAVFLNPCFRTEEFREALVFGQYGVFDFGSDK